MSRTLAALLIVASSLGACSSAAKAPTPPGNTTNPGGDSPVASPSAAETACSTDADCVVVETACCDHCNGGAAVAYNTASAEAHKATGCEQTMCTQMACGAAVARCDQGTCTSSIQPLQP